MQKLFHLSENGNINKFIPRESKSIWDYKKYVWSIGEDKIQNYLFPRECPRICVSDKETIKLKKWISDSKITHFKTHVFVLSNWKERIENCKLYKYQFSNSNFTEIDKIAAYYVSQEIEIPISKEHIIDCIKALKASNTNLKFISKKQMIALKEDVIQNTKEFSIIKWDNL